MFNHDLPLFWDANFLSVANAAAVSASQLIDAAERLQGEAGHGHRKVEIVDESEGERLRHEFEALGWETERHLLMARLRAADRQSDTSLVREVGELDLQPVRERGIRSEPWGGDPPASSVNPFRSFHAEAAVGGPNVPITLPVAGSTICA